MSSTFTKLLRTLRIGKFRHFKGTDLEGNQYFEYPPSIKSLRTRRVVQHTIDRHLSEHASIQLSTQWESWLRHTRFNPPSLEELEKDRIRQITTIENVKRLEQDYILEKQQQQHEQALLSNNAASSTSESARTLDRSAKEEETQTEFNRKRREMNKSPLEAFNPVRTPVDDYKPQQWEPRSRR